MFQKKGSRNEAAVFLAASPLVTAPPSEISLDYITTAPPPNLTRLLHAEVTVSALLSDALGGSSRVFSPAVKRLDERLRDEPKKRLQGRGLC